VLSGFHIVGQLVEQACCLDKYPVGINSRDNEVTIGDLHGNALFLLHFLIKFDVLQLDEGEADYLALAAIYNKSSSDYTAADFQAFDALLTKASVNNNKKLHFLGDILADRGKNDYFTLKIIALLDKSGTDFTILLSNHDAEYILNDEMSGLGEPYHEKMMGRDYSRSIQGLIDSVAKGHVKKADCDCLYREHYLPHIKALEYCCRADDAPSEIFSHAPIDIPLIEKMALELGLPFNSESESSLEESIATINDRVKEILDKREFHRYFEELQTLSSETLNHVAAFFDWGEGVKEVTGDMMNASIAALKGEDKTRFMAYCPIVARRGHVSVDLATKNAKALTRLIWNRDYTDIDTNKTPEFLFIHGHDDKEMAGNIITLDGKLGKGDNNAIGKMKLVRTTYVLPKYYEKARYMIKRTALFDRVLTIDEIEQKGPFTVTDLNGAEGFSLPADGLSNKEIISRLRAVFAYKSYLSSDELLEVISWQRPDGVSLEEINTRLQELYAYNQTPSFDDIESVFTENKIRKVALKRTQKDESMTELEVSAKVKSGEGYIEKYNVTIAISSKVSLAAAEEKLKPLFIGQKLEPTIASIMGQFSNVFKEPKQKGTDLDGIVQANSDIPIVKL
jgi:hypothetical protein